MTAHPRSQALFGGGPWPRGALVADTPGALLEMMFGPEQHDAHVVARRHWEWLEDRRATPEKIAAFEAGVADFMRRRREAELAP